MPRATRSRGRARDTAPCGEVIPRGRCAATARRRRIADERERPIDLRRERAHRRPSPTCRRSRPRARRRGADRPRSSRSRSEGQAVAQRALLDARVAPALARAITAGCGVCSRALKAPATTAPTRRARRSVAAGAPSRWPPELERRPAAARRPRGGLASLDRNRAPRTLGGAPNRASGDRAASASERRRVGRREGGTCSPRRARSAPGAGASTPRARVERGHAATGLASRAVVGPATGWANLARARRSSVAAARGLPLGADPAS